MDFLPLTWYHSPDIRLIPDTNLKFVASNPKLNVFEVCDPDADPDFLIFLTFSFPRVCLNLPWRSSLLSWPPQCPCWALFLRILNWWDSPYFYHTCWVCPSTLTIRLLLKLYESMSCKPLENVSSGSLQEDDILLV